MSRKRRMEDLKWAASRFRLILKDIFVHMKEQQLLLIASSLAYTTILSIVPLLAVSFAIFKSFGGLDTLYETIRPIIIENLARSSGQAAMVAIESYVGKIHAGALGIGGIVALFFTSMSMLSSAEKAINRIWNATIERTFFQRIAGYWFFITLGPFAFAVAVGATSSNDLSFKVLPAGTLGFVLVALAFFSVYKWVPNRRVNWTPPLIAGFITSGLWSLAKFGYGIYTAKVVTYNKIYGSLGAIPIILLWIYIMWVIILSGAAVAATLQKRLDLK